MNDFFDIASMLFVLSISSAFGFLIKSFVLITLNKSLQSEVKSRKIRHSFEAFCVFLSIGVACIALILVQSSWQLIISDYSLEDYLYYIVLSTTAFLLVIFFRVLAPVILGIYVLYCGIFAFLFVDSYSTLPKDFEVSISQGDVIEFQSVVLSYKNLLPMPRYWVSETTVVSQSNNSKSDEQIFHDSIVEFGEESLVSNAIVLLSSLILAKEEGVQNVRLEDVNIQNSSMLANISVYVEGSTVLVDSF